LTTEKRGGGIKVDDLFVGREHVRSQKEADQRKKKSNNTSWNRENKNKKRKSRKENATGGGLTRRARQKGRDLPKADAARKNRPRKAQLSEEKSAKKEGVNH